MGIAARNPNEDEEEREDDTSGEPIDPAYDGGVDGALLTQVDHVAIVVEDLDEAIADHRDAYGVLVIAREEVPDEGYDSAFLEVGASTIQLIAPTSDESEYADFLAEGGPGLHHIGYRVTDLDAVLERFVEQGRALIDEAPVAGPRGSRVAYLDPDASFGVLVQLVER